MERDADFAYSVRDNTPTERRSGEDGQGSPTPNTMALPTVRDGCEGLGTGSGGMARFPGTRAVGKGAGRPGTRLGDPGPAVCEALVEPVGGRRCSRSRGESPLRGGESTGYQLLHTISRTRARAGSYLWLSVVHCPIRSLGTTRNSNGQPNGHRRGVSIAPFGPPERG